MEQQLHATKDPKTVSSINNSLHNLTVVNASSAMLHTALETANTVCHKLRNNRAEVEWDASEKEVERGLKLA